MLARFQDVRVNPSFIQPYVCKLVAVLVILYVGNKSHLKYRNAIALDIAESILAYLDADDFSLQNRRQERLGDALFFHDTLEHSII